MKVSKDWLKQLVNLDISMDELVSLLPFRTIGTKEVTEDFIELDMKGYNRADLLSMRGIAYEVSAITGSQVLFQEPEEADFVWNNAELPQLQVTITNPQLSPVQCVAKIEGLRVEPSDQEWINKLQKCGMRSVNNIADVTNLVMLEYGQPLHAFDSSTLENETIIVRNAKDGEEVITLDGKLRRLETSDIVLSDTKKPIDVAGVMGGKSTEIKDSTTTILLSASMFNPQMLRKTASRLGLHSEASKRFQHGLTKHRLLQAFDAAIKMYEGLGGKLTAISMVGDFAQTDRKIQLTQKKINSLIGVEISSEQVEEYLKKLHFNFTRIGSDPSLEWKVEVPYWRLDAAIEEDLIEEIARLYGYEKIPPQTLQGKLPIKVNQSLFELIDQLKTTLVSIGFTEVYTYSFFSTKVLTCFNWDKNNLVKLANPISSETEYMRQAISPNLIEAAARNLKFINQVSIFEIGKTYAKDRSGNFIETYSLSILLTDNSSEVAVKLYQIFQDLNNKLDLNIATEIKIQTSDFNYLLSKKTLSLEKAGIAVGELGEVHPKILNDIGIEKRVAVLEINLPL